MSDIPGYVKLTVKEIRAWTDKLKEFKRREEICERKLEEKIQQKEKSKWFEKLLDQLSDRTISYWDYRSLRDELIPRYLRGAILNDWFHRIKNLGDDQVIFMDIDDAKLLTWISNELDKPFIYETNT